MVYITTLILQPLLKYILHARLVPTPPSNTQDQYFKITDQ